MRFEFSTAERIVFGGGVACDLPRWVSGLGQRALVVTGRSPARTAALQESLRGAGLWLTVLPIEGEPTISVIEDGLTQARNAGCDVVVAIGGGSAIDAGKALAALATNPGPVLDYLEIIGLARPLAQAPLPFVAVPTTAGTGAEVTENAVLSSPEHRLKVSLRDPRMLPRLAIVDPQLTRDLPPAVTARTGMDALTQLIEPFVSPKATPMTDALCRDGIARAARSLKRAFTDGQNPAAREDMALSSLLGGIALANAKLGAVHGFAAVLGGVLPGAPHGAICARLLPLVCRANLTALSRRAPHSPSLERYGEVARLLTGNPGARPEDGLAWLQTLGDDLSIPSLSTLGLTPWQFDEIAAKARQTSSMKGNPIELTLEDLLEILQTA